MFLRKSICSMPGVARKGLKSSRWHARRQNAGQGACIFEHCFVAVFLAAFLGNLIGRPALAQTDEEIAKQRCPKPTEFVSVFSFGYGGDATPKDDAKFEELLVKVKDHGFNVLKKSPRTVEEIRLETLNYVDSWIQKVLDG